MWKAKMSRQLFHTFYFQMNAFSPEKICINTVTPTCFHAKFTTEVNFFSLILLHNGKKLLKLLKWKFCLVEFANFFVQRNLLARSPPPPPKVALPLQVVAA